jgi:hypothetical protein
MLSDCGETMQPILTNLIDSSFENPSFTLGGDNADEHPQFIEWDRTCSQDGPIFFTDKHLTDVEDFADDRRKKIALLIEPPSLSATHYSNAWRLRESFDQILTFNADFFTLNPLRVLYYPLGGSWIHPTKWGIHHAKTDKVSIITSQKQGAPGHKLRHRIAARYPEVARYGRDFRSMTSKTEGLSRYRYSIVVESVRINGYFSEKLIDCLSVGTTAIYWGAPDIAQWFHGNIIAFNGMEQLDLILSNLSRMKRPDNERSMSAQFAKIYRCAEDRIFHHYGKLIWGQTTGTT